MKQRRYYVEAEDETVRQPEELTPNQLRDLEEHRRAMERWGGMPKGNPDAAPSAGHMVVFNDDGNGTHGTMKWLDMAFVGAIHYHLCRECGNKFFSKMRRSRVCPACIKVTVKSEGRKNGHLAAGRSGRQDAPVREVSLARYPASAGDVRVHGNGKKNIHVSG